MQNQKVIEELGYTSKEAKVYLAALSLGESHISDIAKSVNMARSSTQIIAEKLCRDGLLTFYSTKRYKYWVAEKPERLLDRLEKRKEMVEEALPNLVALRKVNRGRRYKNKNSELTLAIFRTIADASQEAVLIANKDTDIEYVNASWEDKFGYLLAEIRGEKTSMLKSGKTPERVYEEMWNTLSLKKMFQTNEVIDRKKDGSYLKVLTTIFPLEMHDTMYYIQMCSDITGKKEFENLQKQFLSDMKSSLIYDEKINRRNGRSDRRRES